MAETDPTWKNWGKIKPHGGLFYQDYIERSEILGELLARSDAEVKRLRSRVAELEEERDRLRDIVDCPLKLMGLRCRTEQAKDIVRLQEALVEERAAKMHLEEWIDAPGKCAEAGLACSWEEIPEVLEMTHRPGVFWKAYYRGKARAALGNHPETPDGSANPSETPISSGE